MPNFVGVNQLLKNGQNKSGGKRVGFLHGFEEIVSVENLLQAWKEFIRGKRKKKDVQEFQLNLMDNIFQLHSDLANFNYKHGGYQVFNICDPKPRNIHKATVGDRLLRHAIYRILYPFFDRTFISDSFSCRNNKGTHKALSRFRSFAYKVSKNNTRTCWILKCDIKKFFASIDQEVLLTILKKHITGQKVIWLLQRVVGSFSTRPGIGLPLGNLISQLFVNIYMNEFDQFMKYKLRVRYYLRYADDFVVLSENKLWLEKILLFVEEFLNKFLRLELHPDKIFIKTLYSGLDFLGWVNFFDHRVLRTTTKRRMLKKLAVMGNFAIRSSYLGLLKHGNSNKLKNKIAF